MYIKKKILTQGVEFLQLNQNQQQQQSFLRILHLSLSIHSANDKYIKNIHVYKRKRD